MELRDYQIHAVDALLADLLEKKFPVVSLPTGAGKSVVVAGLVQRCRAMGMGKIVVTVPTRELAEQNERALRRMMPGEDIGVVCAALGRKEGQASVIVGTPKSLVSHLPYGPVDLVVVDEAHQMPLHKGSEFAKLFDVLPDKRLTLRCGLSATTFRSADGAIFGGPSSWFSSQPFEMPVADLMARGFLASIRYVAPRAKMTVKGVQKSAGDYNQTQLVRANLDLVRPQVRLILDAMQEEGRRKAMVFAVTVAHAEEYAREFKAAGQDAALIVGSLSADQRRANVEDFKSGKVRIAVTVQAALTGFDVPDIDLIASCRPTMSAIIHTQSIGRGTRPAPGKNGLLVMDFARNIPAFGPVEAPNFDGSGQPKGAVAPWFACDSCGTYNHAGEAKCSHCRAAIKRHHLVTAKDLEFGTIDFWRESKAIESVVAEHGRIGLPVQSIAVHGYRKKTDPRSISLMVSFGFGGQAIVREWHKNLSGRAWEARWKSLMGETPAPKTIPEAYSRRGELVRPASVSIDLQDGRFWRIASVDHDDGDDEASAGEDGGNVVYLSRRQA